MAVKLSRQEYCEMFGPTVGDKIHLADTGLIAEMEICPAKPRKTGCWMSV